MAQSVANRQSLFLGDDDVLVTEDGELLSNDGLTKRQDLLQLPDGVSPAHENFQDSDSHRMCQRGEELRRRFRDEQATDEQST